MKWEELPLADRAKLMAAAVKNGYTDIRSIKEAYANYLNQKLSTGNRYAEGGDTNEPEVINLLDTLPIWKALENIDYKVIADPEFTKDKTGAGSIEYFSAEEPEGITYTNGYHRDHPMPGHDVILYDPNINDTQDIRLDALHIMPKDPTYNTLNLLYREAARDGDVAWAAKQRYEEDVAKYGKNALDAANMTPQQYFDNEADALLRNMLIEGSPDYISSKKYYPYKEKLLQWNEHLMPYIDNIQQYLESGERPTWINIDNYQQSRLLPELTVTNQKAYGGNLFKGGGNKNQEINKRKDYYRQQLILRGLRGAQLEAVLANMQVESGFNPNAHNKSSGAHGLMQWLGARKPKSWSEKDQLDYIAATYNKLGGNEWLDKAAWKRFNETTDPAEAARLFRRYWERPEKSSWHATDKYFGKSYLPEETNNLISQIQDITWNDVQEKRKRFELTPEEERLYNSKPTLFYNADYADWNDHTNSKTFEQAYAPYALNSELDNSPSNGWALYNSLLNTQSLNDPLSWMTMMASLSPRTTSQLKEAANTMYQLFAPQGDDYMYHGLNFAAYGGKVNKFDGITGNSTLENKGINDTDLITKYGFRYVPISSIYDLLNDDELNYNMNNEGMTLKEYYSKYPTAKIAVNNNGRIVTANDLKDLEQKSTLSSTADFSPENWLSLRVERPDGTKYDQSDIDSLNSHQNEYHNIEIAAKQNGSWLKMPDGSTWGGDPRIWVMMQSNAFRNNYIQKPWYTGLAEWNTTYDTPYGVATDKVTRAPFFNGQMWFSNSNLYGNTFANYISENGQNWRAHNPKEWNINGQNFIAAIPKVGNYRYLNGPTNGTHDHWVYMPYKLENNSIIRLNNDELTTKSVFKGTPNTNIRKDNQKILTDTIANWSRDLGDSGLFMNNINDGPVVKEVEGRTKYIPTIINEFISQPGFTDKVKFILGNNGDFNINDPYKYRALGGPLIMEANNLFYDGGFYDLPEQRAYQRAVNLKAPYNNYEDAIDMNDSIALRMKKLFDKGVSNCTLTTSLLYGPPIARARTIVTNPYDNNFYEVDDGHIVPGTMVIASYPYISDYNPDQKYHTMIVTGFADKDEEYTFRDGTKYQIKKGEPLVSYSRGKASADNYVHNIPLSVYNANSEGKTFNRYYRPIDEGYPQVMLPELVVRN